MLNQQFSKNSDFPCGALTRRPDDEHAALWYAMTRSSVGTSPFTGRVVIDRADTALCKPATA